MCERVGLSKDQAGSDVCLWLPSVEGFAESLSTDREETWGN